MNNVSESRAEIIFVWVNHSFVDDDITCGNHFRVDDDLKSHVVITFMWTMICDHMWKSFSYG